MNRETRDAVKQRSSRKVVSFQVRLRSFCVRGGFGNFFPGCILEVYSLHLADPTPLVRRCDGILPFDIPGSLVTNSSFL